MANEKFSQFNSVTTLDGTESLVGLQAADNSEFSVRFFPITVKTSISSAEILTMYSSPVTLVAAPGAGRFINVLSVLFRLNFGTTQYLTNYTTRIAIGSFRPIVATNEILGSTTDDFIVATPTQTLELAGSATWINTALTSEVLAGNPTGGDGTLDIYVTYNILTL